RTWIVKTADQRLARKIGHMRPSEGVYFFENFPRMLAHKNDEYHKEFNKLIGIDDVYCREIGGTRVMDKRSFGKGSVQTITQRPFFPQCAQKRTCREVGARRL